MSEGQSPVTTTEVRHYPAIRKFFFCGLRTFKWLAIGLFTIILLCHSGAAEQSFPPFRIGFASNMFSDVNENDGKAAIKVWGQVIAKQRNVPVSPTPIIFKDTDEMLRSLQEKKVDAVAIVMTDYAKLRKKVRFEPIFLTSNSGSVTERYILLAHRDSSLKSLADLQGRSFQFQTNPRTGLARLWLDILLIQRGYPMTSRLAGKISQNTKLSKVVLPVFFRQDDACIITRSGFNTMSELHPQLARKLTVLAESS